MNEWRELVEFVGESGSELKLESSDVEIVIVVGVGATVLHEDDGAKVKIVGGFERFLEFEVDDLWGI